jgi:hypothetical protein
VDSVVVVMVQEAVLTAQPVPPEQVEAEVEDLGMPAE